MSLVPRSRIPDMTKDRPGVSLWASMDRQLLPRSLKVLCIALHEQANDETEQTENSGEDFNGQNLDEPRNVLMGG